MNIAILHPQCRVRWGAIKMALLTAHSLKNQGHTVMFYTFDHDPDCFPELQEGLTIITEKTKQNTKNIAEGKLSQPEKKDDSNHPKNTFDTVDTKPSFWTIFRHIFPRIFPIISIAWDIRQVDIVIANNPPMQVVGVLARFFSLFSTYHQRLTVIWWHHHIPWYYQPRQKEKKGVRINIKSLKWWIERHWIIPYIKYMIVTSYYTAFCLEKYCGRKSTVIHPVIINIPDEIQNNPPKEIDFDNQINYQRPIVLFSHGRLEPGKGFDTIVKIWKELQATENKEIKLIIAGEWSMKKQLETEGATVIPYREWLLWDLKNTDNDILAVYLSTIDAFGMAPLEAQIAGLPVIIFDRWGARETVLLDNNKQPMAQLIDTEQEILPAITYFIQQRSLHKRVSNVNFCHHTEYFWVSRLDADIRSLIDSLR